MSKKDGVKLYLFEEALQTLGHSGDSLSYAANKILGRYERFVDENTPKFSESEWNFLRDSLNGALYDTPQLLQADLLWWAAAECCSIENLHEKWGLDREAWLEKLRNLTTSQVIATIEVVERWWKSPRQ